MYVTYLATNHPQSLVAIPLTYTEGPAFHTATKLHDAGHTGFGYREFTASFPCSARPPPAPALIAVPSEFHDCQYQE